jgi:hypothetical protein
MAWSLYCQRLGARLLILVSRKGRAIAINSRQAHDGGSHRHSLLYGVASGEL